MSEQEQQTNEDRLNEAKLIEKTGSVTVENTRGSIHCLTIVGQIEGHQILSPQQKTTKYEHVMPQLAAIE